MDLSKMIGPRTLELRIHGIKNTPPGEMLGVAEEDVTRVIGDELGAFWIEKKPKGHSRVRREAYSWGALSRSGGGKLAMIGQVFVHLGWFLILPFGLCNVAYWARRIPPQKLAHAWFGGAGTAHLRLFALGLTLFYVTALSSVALDLIGAQCFRAQYVCAQVPAAFEVLPADNRGLRLSILALLPLAVITIMFVISHRARVRYEPTISKGISREAKAGAEIAADNLFATAEFWVHARVASASERLHLAAATFLLALFVAMDTLNVTNASCGWSRDFFDFACLAQGRLLYLGLLACLFVAFLGIAFAGVMVIFGSETRPNPHVLDVHREIAAWALSGAAILLVATGALSSAVSAPTSALETKIVTELESPPVTMGLEAAPTIVIAALLALSLAGRGWRRLSDPDGRSNPRLLLSSALLLGALVALGRWSMAGGTLQGWIEKPAEPIADVPIWTLPLLAAVLVAAQFALVRFWPRADVDRLACESWGGTGPGVIMLLAAGVAMALGSLLVVGFATYLALPATVATADETGGQGIAGMWRGDGVQLNSFGTSNSLLSVPPPYVEFGLAVLVIIVVMGVVAAIFALSSATRLRLLSTPLLTTPPPRDGGEEILGKTTGYHGGAPQKPITNDRATLRMLKARRFAALAQRGERILGWLAGCVGSGLAFTVIVRFPRDITLETSTDAEWWLRAFSWILSATPAIAIGSLSAIALGAIGVIAANALTTKERPVGLLWDLICFLPRAGHPFGPPCYADRVVPEVKARINKWFTDGGILSSRRRVVLSAHSLGAVLAVASIFAIRAENPSRVERIGLLTYGTQLRPYFGRFFPELLGPDVLGVRPSLGPQSLSADPWFRQVQRDEDGSGVPASADPKSLREILSGSRGTRWVNLWRRTDFLGFPVNSFVTSGDRIDRGTAEFETKTYLKTIATHGNYPDMPQYEQAFDELERRLRLH